MMSYATTTNIPKAVSNVSSVLQYTYFSEWSDSRTSFKSCFFALMERLSDAAAWLLHFLVKMAKTMKPPVYALAARHSSEVQRRVGRDNNSSMVVHKAAASKFEVLTYNFPFGCAFLIFYSPFHY